MLGIVVCGWRGIQRHTNERSRGFIEYEDDVVFPLMRDDRTLADSCKYSGIIEEKEPDTYKCFVLG